MLFFIFKIGFSEHIRRIAGEIREHAVRRFQIKHLKYGIRRFAVLSFDNRMGQSHFFGGQVVFKDSLAVAADGGWTLHGVLLQKRNDFVHLGYPP